MQFGAQVVQPNHHAMQAYCYEFYAGAFASDLPYLHNWVGRGTRVLEIGVGTGRVARVISAHASQYVGIDTSCEMIEQGARNLSSVVFINDDMRSFSLPWKFDRILFPFRVIQYCPSTEDIERSIRAARQHLAPGGRLLLNVFPIDDDFVMKWHGRKHTETFSGPDGSTWTKLDSHKIDISRSRLIRSVEFHREGVLMGINDESLTWVDSKRAEHMCRASGLSVTNVVHADSLQPYSGCGEYFLEAELASE